MTHRSREDSDWLDGVEPANHGEPVSFSVRLGPLAVGALDFEGGEWVFRYSEGFQRQSEVKPIVDFPRVDKEYRSASLWPFFLLRIPSVEQPAVKDFVHKYRLTEITEAAMLRQFGRRSVANPFELVPT